MPCNWIVVRDGGEREGAVGVDAWEGLYGCWRYLSACRVGRKREVKLILSKPFARERDAGVSVNHNRYKLARCNR